jgi:RTX calcium-binding nonapeptide repeat (4 copies)
MDTKIMKGGSHRALRNAALGLAAVAAVMAAGGAQASAQEPAPPTCDGRQATIVGSAGPDRLVGTSGADVIWAGPGDDLVNGGSGADVICGNGGDDRLMGDNGADRIFGGGGNDACSTVGATLDGCQAGTQTRFMPTRHGFPFANAFSFNRTINYGVGSYNISQPFGLCGGMVFAAFDTFLKDDPAPGTSTTPSSGQTYDYVQGRLVDSLTVGFGYNLGKFVELQPKSNSELTTVTRSTAIQIREKLEDDGLRPIPLGVIFAQPNGALTDNHQVLVIGYFKRADGPRMLKIYDPNRPDRMAYVNTETKRITDQDGSNSVPFRGIFVEKYESKTPPWS